LAALAADDDADAREWCGLCNVSRCFGVQAVASAV